MHRACHTDVYHTLEADHEDTLTYPIDDDAESHGKPTATATNKLAAAATLSSTTPLSLTLSTGEKSEHFEDENDTSVVWVDDEAERAQVLHKHMDYILRALKNVPEYSTPFLRPVTLRMAPGYFDVIKQPMDFLTMGKKLSQGAYPTLEEFKADLFLIYRNCREYNEDEDPENEFE